METYSAEVSRRIREERERLGLNQEEFGVRAEVGRATQIFYEAGSRFPTTKYFGALEQHGIDTVYLLTGSRSKSTYSDLEWLHFKPEALWAAFSAAISIGNPSASQATVESSLAAFKAFCAIGTDHSDPNLFKDLATRLK